MSSETREIINEEVRMFTNYLSSLPYGEDRRFIRRLKEEKGVDANHLRNARYGYIRFSYALKVSIEELAGCEIFSKDPKYTQSVLKRL